LDIAKVFPSALVDTLLGKDASEANIKAWPLEDYRILHFACHGFLNERYPFRSSLILSRSARAEEDGFLEMREIYGLSMNAALVVLSACQSGKGLLERSEGVMDLARPFFYAGARSVLASLWPVDDEATRALMSDFYHALAAGTPVEIALSGAKQRMLRSSWSHPFYWAGFLLQGVSPFSQLPDPLSPRSHRPATNRPN
jgi:CHAT domain-containing protein